MLRNILFQVIRKVAGDPKVQKQAAETYEDTVRPRVKSAQKFVKKNMDFAKKELGDVARETNPLEEPSKFLKKARERLFDPEDSDETANR